MGQLFSSKCESDVRLNGKTAVVTGANTGIGKATAKDFYERGAKVYLACRNITGTNEAIDDIKQQCQGKENLGELIVIELDLSRLKSVRECAEKLLKDEKHIDILVNNAGIIGIPYKRTEDGYETTFQTNHLGHFLFTLLLMPLLIKSTPIRIINVTSNAHGMRWPLSFPFDLTDLNFEKRKYSPWMAYGESKLCNILFTKELVQKLTDNNVEGISVYAVHPGGVSTEAGRHFDEGYMRGMTWVWSTFARAFFKTAEQGAQTTIYCSVDVNCAEETGLYYAECKPCEPSQNAKDAKLAKDLWDLSLKYVGLEENYNPFKKQ